MLSTKATAGQTDIHQEQDGRGEDFTPTFAGSLDLATASLTFSTDTEIESVLIRATSRSAETRLTACQDILDHLENSAGLEINQLHQLAATLKILGDDPEERIRALAHTVLPAR